MAKLKMVRIKHVKQLLVLIIVDMDNGMHTYICNTEFVFEPKNKQKKALHKPILVDCLNCTTAKNKHTHTYNHPHHISFQHLARITYFPIKKNRNLRNSYKLGIFRYIFVP